MSRRLSFGQRFIGVPLGVLWLVILLLLAVPVIIYMTVLFHLIQAGKALAGLLRRSVPRTGST